MWVMRVVEEVSVVDRSRIQSLVICRAQSRGIGRKSRAAMERVDARRLEEVLSSPNGMRSDWSRSPLVDHGA
ncbi:MAG TPA: hypothetical protein DCR15_05610 [Arthrobacter bacterium]|nr:hypothetical protein [Arthrobacter sp.]